MPAYLIEQHTLPNSGAHVTTARPESAGEDPRPLIVSLHYGGPVSPWYGRGLLESVVTPALQELGAIFVAPDCAAERWIEPVGVNAINAAVDWISTQFAVDMTRTALVGYSKGGIGTWALTERFPEKFSCGVVMAGAPPPSLDPERARRWSTPLYIIHAEQDELIPLAPTADMAATLAAAGAPVNIEILPGVSHFETHRFATPLRAAAPWLRAQWGRKVSG